MSLIRYAADDATKPFRLKIADREWKLSIKALGMLLDAANEANDLYLRDRAGKDPRSSFDWRKEVDEL